jgi:tetratricopeptide (TPR) repeat protein
MIECDVRGRRALEVDSRSSFVPGYLSSLFEDAGRIDESLQFARQSLANDPYKPAKLARMIRLLEASGNSDQAERIYEEGRRLWPDSGRMRRSRLLGMAELGNYAALAAFADPVADAPMLDPAPFRALIAAQRTHGLPGAQRACDSKGLKPFMLTLCMAVLADLGDLDRSFAIAAVLYPAWHAAHGTDEDRLWLDNPGGFQTDPLTGPAARSMRSDPRFLELAQKVGLLAYWRSTRLPDFCAKAHEPVCARITRKPI